MCEKCDELRRLAGATMHGGTAHTLMGVVAKVYEYADTLREKRAEFSVREALMLSAALHAIRQAGRLLQSHLREYVMTDEDFEHASHLAGQLGYSVEEIEQLADTTLIPEDLVLMHKLQIKAETMLGRTMDDGSMDEECPKKNGDGIDWSDVFGPQIGEA